jgi:hypothetical protein
MNCPTERFYIIAKDFQYLEHYSKELGLNPSNALEALARAVASSPMWLKMPTCTIVVKKHPIPALSIVGSLDEVGEARLSALAQQIREGCNDLLYVDYFRAEAFCHILAKKLVKRFGKDIENFHFYSIPRGGTIVLGILSYLLNLNPRQLNSQIPPEATLLVVDDCALSGKRFGDFLRENSSQKIVLATLFSHSGLKSAILNREPRVLDHISAHDLKPQKTLGKNVDIQAKVEANLGEERYWIGRLGYLCFAWTEPDWLFLNPASDSIESGWRILPPEKCLKNFSLKMPQIFIQPIGHGSIRPSQNVIFLSQPRKVLLCNMASGETCSLEGHAADMWMAIVKRGDIEAVLKDILAISHPDEPDLESDLRELIEDLVSNGFLIWSEQQESSKIGK